MYTFADQFGGVDGLHEAYQDFLENEPYIWVKRSFDDAFHIGTPDEVPHPDLTEIAKGIKSVRRLSDYWLDDYLQNAKKEIEKSNGN